MYSRQAKFSLHTSLWTTKAGDSQTPVLRTHIPQMPFSISQYRVIKKDVLVLKMSFLLKYGTKLRYLF
jgi:hypothetical protein